MSETTKTLRDNTEQNDLEKIDHDVENCDPKIHQRLLLSTASVYPEADNEKETERQFGVSEDELGNVKSVQNVREGAHKVLQNLEIGADVKEITVMRDSLKSGLKKELDIAWEKILKNEISERNSEEQIDEKDFEEQSVDTVMFGEDFQDSLHEAKEDFIKLLNRKHISEDLKNQLLQNGITEEAIRLLRSLGFSIKDIGTLQKLWRIQTSKSDEIDPSRLNVSEASITRDKISLDQLYLKKYFSAPIKKALCEILLRKPIDPIEFLGHWLLHFKCTMIIEGMNFLRNINSKNNQDVFGAQWEKCIRQDCEEREMKRKECQKEFLRECEQLKIEQIFGNGISCSKDNKGDHQEESENTWSILEDSVNSFE